jgi:hypothetical protein
MAKRFSSTVTSRPWTFRRGASNRSFWCVSLLLLAAGAGGTAPEVNWEVQGVGRIASVVGGPFNPANQLARLPAQEYGIHLRPDAFVSIGRFDLMLRPRAVLRHVRTDAGGAADWGTETDVFVNEWRLRWQLTPTLDVAVGREHLLWGPARALMPSNPFTPDTGRDNPFRDVGGRDFVRANLLAGSWTLSAISNIDPGRDPQRPSLPPLESIAAPLEFRRVHALKAERIGYAYQLALIGARTEGGPWHIGGYVDWTAGVATRLYADARVVSARTLPEPIADAALPIGWGFARAARGRGGLGVAGVAHTLPQGTTLTFEALYQHGGYGDGTARNLRALAASAAAAFASTEPRRIGEAAGLLAVAADPGAPLLRQRYGFVQVEHRRSDGRVSGSARYLHGVDDGSGRLALAGEWQPGDRSSVFAVAMLGHGGSSSEFGRYQRAMVMAGIRVFY